MHSAVHHCALLKVLACVEVSLSLLSVALRASASTASSNLVVYKREANGRLSKHGHV